MPDSSEASPATTALLADAKQTRLNGISASIREPRNGIRVHPCYTKLHKERLTRGIPKRLIL